MRYRKLGRWGMQVSEVGLGSWLTYGGSVANDTATRCIKRAYELGVNFFDTANAYMQGGAEIVVGKALAQMPRDEIVLATKVFFPMGDKPNQGGLSRKHVFEAAHRSLRRLQVDYIDLYQCHRYDPDTPLDETVCAMNDLIRRGKILYWGTSGWTAEQISSAVEVAESNGWSAPVSNQPQYNALWREIEADILPTSERLGLGTVVWSPLAMGILTGKYTSVDNIPDQSRAATQSRGFMQKYFNQQVLDAVAELRPVADDAGVTVGQLALRWILRQSAVSSVIAGASKPEHVEVSVAASECEIGHEAIGLVDRILAPVAAS